MLLGVGYVARSIDQYEASLKKYKYMSISESEFHDIFAEAIVSGRPNSNAEVEILTGLGEDSSAPWAENPRFAHYLREESNINDGKVGRQALSVLEAGFSKKLELILQIPGDNIDKESALMNLGIDSLVAVEIRSWFLKELNVDMPVLKVLSGTSLTDLCKDALARLPATENEGAANGVIQASAQAPPSITIDWEKEIASLCEGLRTK